MEYITVGRKIVHIDTWLVTILPRCVLHSTRLSKTEYSNENERADWNNIRCGLEPCSPVYSLKRVGDTHVDLLRLTLHVVLSIHMPWWCYSPCIFTPWGGRLCKTHLMLPHRTKGLRPYMVLRHHSNQSNIDIVGNVIDCHEIGSHWYLFQGRCVYDTNWDKKLED